MINSLEFGIPVTLISEAVYSRCLSSIKDERMIANKALSLKKEFKFPVLTGERRAEFIRDIKYVLIYINLYFNKYKGFICIKDSFICSRIYVNERSIKSIWMES